MITILNNSFKQDEQERKCSNNSRYNYIASEVATVEFTGHWSEEFDKTYDSMFYCENGKTTMINI